MKSYMMRPQNCFGWNPISIELISVVVYGILGTSGEFIYVMDGILLIWI